jgi:hypothetical protein
MEGQDEAKFPSYMELVDNLLKHYKFSKPDQRSYFRLLSNLEEEFIQIKYKYNNTHTTH